MSEGELYKKILEEGKIEFKYDISAILKEFLDEAAKEFPQSPTDDGETSFLRKMWFRKWFGEVEKK